MHLVEATSPHLVHGSQLSSEAVGQQQAKPNVRWRRIGIAVLFGSLAGGAFASLHYHAPAVSNAVQANVLSPVVQLQQVESLRARNRRLEALVTVLRDRTQPDKTDLLAVNSVQAPGRRHRR